MSNGVEFWEDYEVLTVETPENIELRLPLAGFGPRFLALVLDSIIQTIAAIVLMIIAFTVAAGTSLISPGASTLFMAIAVLFSVLVATVGYYIVFEFLWNGQTPGKRATGIRVVRRGGLPLTARDVVVRNLVRIVDYLPTHYLVGLVSFFTSANQQRLGDLVADTAVIREFSSRQPYHWVGHAARSPGQEERALLPQFSYVIGEYLMRREQLALDVRLGLTDRIISALGHDPKPLSLSQRDSYLATLLNWASGEQ